MRSRDGLLLINEPRLARYLPGKIYEYIAAGRPLVVFGEGGEVGTLVTRLGAGFLLPLGDPDALEQAFRSLRAFGRSAEAESAVEQWLARHTREALSVEVLALLESLIVPLSRRSPVRSHLDATSVGADASE